MITSSIENNTFDYEKKSLKEALYSKENQNNEVKSVDFDTLASGFSSNQDARSTVNKQEQIIKNTEVNEDDDFIDF